MATHLEIEQSQRIARVPVTVIELIGEMDSSNVERFQMEAQQAVDTGTRYVLIDLSRLTYISSGGLRAFFVLAKALSANDGNSSGSKTLQSGSFKSPYLKLLKPTPEVRNILDAMGFTMSIEVFSDLNEVIASF